jgi:hypothetical protein
MALEQRMDPTELKIFIQKNFTTENLSSFIFPKYPFSGFSVICQFLEKHWTCSCPSDLSLKLNKYASSSLPLTFLMGRVFLTVFNKKREIKNSLLGKNTQFLKSSISETAACTKFAWASNCSELNLV